MSSLYNKRTSTDIPVQSETKKAYLQRQPDKGVSDGKKMWTTEERTVVKNYFMRNIRMLKVSGKIECTNCLKENQVLASRSWKNIKYCVYNLITTCKKQSKSKLNYS
ncbi:uncharacterized protein LOC102801397 [Saccoglossus kowalevskii]|uniref:Uncharacterized protein LOC102801397 n=1 Tax=Saccoglossus kowalevskii TaxID=10224 RepID=A0ABM0M2I6_SACKO|nr:PREDICTED: uncharacterized protein LOC102801397 [Saccoglossus kowalevskii]